MPRAMMVLKPTAAKSLSSLIQPPFSKSARQESNGLRVIGHPLIAAARQQAPARPEKSNKRYFSEVEPRLATRIFIRAVLSNYLLQPFAQAAQTLRAGRGMTCTLTTLPTCAAAAAPASVAALTAATSPRKNAVT